MKQSLLAIALLAIGCQSSTTTEPVAEHDSSESPQVTEVAAFNSEGAPTVEFSVPGMVCEFSCTPAVKKTLAEQPGVKDVKVDLATKTAVVAVDKETFNADAAVAALIDIQFVDSKVVAQGTELSMTTDN